MFLFFSGVGASRLSMWHRKYYLTHNERGKPSSRPSPQRTSIPKKNPHPGVDNPHRARSSYPLQRAVSRNHRFTSLRHSTFQLRACGLFLTLTTLPVRFRLSRAFMPLLRRRNISSWFCFLNASQTCPRISVILVFRASLTSTFTSTIVRPLCLWQCPSNMSFLLFWLWSISDDTQ